MQHLVDSETAMVASERRRKIMSNSRISHVSAHSTPAAFPYTEKQLVSSYRIDQTTGIS